MASSRGEFSSSLGFIMAAAGSAIGLGNIWGFPTNTAENGGAAFVIVYLILAFIIGYPVLMAEFTIGRYSRSNMVGAYHSIKGGKPFVPAGFIGLITVGLILSFYAIIAGKMIAFALEPIATLIGMDEFANWLVSGKNESDLLFTSLFYLMTIGIITKGVKSGIEKWSTRLMPTLLVMIIILIVYVFTLDGASEGLKTYLLPDFNNLIEGDLIQEALGQAFFSLSLGVGTMLVYGSYISKKENLVKLGVYVTLADVSIAFLAGLLIIPAMFVAANNGMQIYNEDGGLISGPGLIFDILPSLFETMGVLGYPVGLLFFILMTIAALTSSISMLEVPVSYAVDTKQRSRIGSTWIIGGFIWLVSILLIYSDDKWFGYVADAATKYSQPLLGLILCVFIGWAMNRNSVLEELKKGYPEVENSFFMKVWPFFVKILCPILIAIVFIRSI